MRQHAQPSDTQSFSYFQWCVAGIHQWSEGWAVFNFAWSLVEEVMISIYCVEEDTCYQQPVRVEICDRKSVCRLCKEIDLTSRWKDFRIKCLDSLKKVETEVEGNQIKIHHPGTSINVCQVEIFGKG